VLQLRSATAIIAIVTVAVSAIAILIGGVQWSAEFGGFIPARLTGQLALPGAIPAYLTPWTSALLHGGWLHLAINMVMLAFAGSQVERVIGASGLVFAYVVGALFAAAAQFIRKVTGIGKPKPAIATRAATKAAIPNQKRTKPSVKISAMINTTPSTIQPIQRNCSIRYRSPKF